jgi:hemolysin activation/secretion protein
MSYKGEGSMNFVGFMICVCILCSSTGFAQTIPAGQSSPQQKNFIRDIVVRGFILPNHTKVDNLIATFREKELSLQDINRLVESIQQVYQGAGYRVNASYQAAGQQVVITIVRGGS